MKATLKQQIKVDHNMPIPVSMARAYMDALHAMKPGDSVVVARKHYFTVRATARKQGVMVTARNVEKGVSWRVWKVSDEKPVTE